MQMNLDSASVKNRVVPLQTSPHLRLPLRADKRPRPAAIIGSLAIERAAIRRGDSWENTVWLLIGLSALAGMVLAL